MAAPCGPLQPRRCACQSAAGLQHAEAAQLSGEIEHLPAVHGRYLDASVNLPLRYRIAWSAKQVGPSLPRKTQLGGVGC